MRKILITLTAVAAVLVGTTAAAQAHSTTPQVRDTNWPCAGC